MEFLSIICIIIIFVYIAGFSISIANNNIFKYFFISIIGCLAFYGAIPDVKDKYNTEIEYDYKIILDYNNTWIINDQGDSTLIMFDEIEEFIIQDNI